MTSKMELVKYQVGDLFPLEKVVNHFKGSNGGGSLDYDKEDKTVSLYIGIPSPTKREIREFNGLIRFALYPNPQLNTSLLMICFEREFIFDLVFDINVLDIDMDGMIEGNRFSIFLIDADTGILKGMRMLGLGENFIHELNKITKNDRRYTSKEYLEWVQILYQYDLPTLWRMSNRIDWDK